MRETSSIVTSPLCVSHRRSVLSPTKAPRNVSSSLPRRCSSLRNAEEEEEEVGEVEEEEVERAFSEKTARERGKSSPAAMNKALEEESRLRLRGPRASRH